MEKEKSPVVKRKVKAKKKPKINTEIVTAIKKLGATPFPWTPELEVEIADYISTHCMSLQRCVENNKHWPQINAIYERIHKSPVFGEMYLTAKQQQVFVMNEETIQILDKMESNSELVPWGREAIKQYNWQAGRLKPRVFGDKIFNEVTNVNHEGSLDKLK